MKYDFFTYKDEIDRLPILDWHGFYFVDYQYRSTEGFSGQYNKILCVTLTLFRRSYSMTLYWGFGQTTPQEAKSLYHARRKDIE